VTRIVYYVAASADGFIATPDGGIDWLTPFQESGEDYGYHRFFASVDAVVLGRRTFDQALTFGEWPYAEKPAWVLTSREISDLPPLTKATADSPRRIAEDLATAGFERAWLVGGGEVAGAFQRAGLIDEFAISVMPLLLGEGVPLFGTGGGVASPLRLQDSIRYPDGVMQQVYRRAHDAAGG
jgi:dihydrofolate reductase